MALSNILMIPGIGKSKLPKGSISVSPPAPEVADDVTLTFNATPGQIPDPSTFTYQWYFDNNLLVGEINDSLTLTAVDEFDEGLYQCYVTSSEGTKIFNKNVSILSFYYLRPGGTELYFRPDATSLYLQPTPLTIVTSGLQVFLDGDNVLSYPGSGSTWFDISGNSNDMTLTGGPTNTGGVMIFTTTSYGEISTLDYTNQDFTIMCASRYNGGTSKRVVSSSLNNWFIGHNGGTVDGYYAEGWIQMGSTSDNNWRIYAGTEDYTNDQYSFYIDDVSIVSNDNGGSAGFDGLCLARYRTDLGANEESDCEVGFILIYDRILTTGEMTQNFNFFKARYGL